MPTRSGNHRLRNLERSRRNCNALQLLCCPSHSQVDIDGNTAFASEFARVCHARKRQYRACAVPGVRCSNAPPPRRRSPDHTARKVAQVHRKIRAMQEGQEADE
jgi:hypothetical protein